jgi:bifunctional non-homologous end joining protein LigD
LDEIGSALFRKAGEFGLGDIVSKRADRPYRADRSQRLDKVKNHKHPTIERVKNSFA